MDRGAWRTTVHGVTKSQTRLSDQHLPPCRRQFYICSWVMEHTGRELCIEPVSCSDTSLLNAFVPQPLRPLHPCWPACLLPQAGFTVGVSSSPTSSQLERIRRLGFHSLRTTLVRVWKHVWPPTPLSAPPYSSFRPQTPTSHFQGVFPDLPVPPPEISCSPYWALLQPGVWPCCLQQQRRPPSSPEAGRVKPVLAGPRFPQVESGPCPSPGFWRGWQRLAPLGWEKHHSLLFIRHLRAFSLHLTASSLHANLPLYLSLLMRRPVSLD